MGTTRVDVAAINGYFTGCEIKSGRDNLARLARQVPAYSAVLDAAVLVVEGARRANQAGQLIPDWWGIWTASPDATTAVHLDVLRAAGRNPSPEPLAIAQLLWREEALAVLARYGNATGLRRATRWRLWEALAEQLSLPLLQHATREAIKVRRDW